MTGCAGQGARGRTPVAPVHDRHQGSRSQVVSQPSTGSDITASTSMHQAISRRSPKHTSKGTPCSPVGPLARTRQRPARHAPPHLLLQECLAPAALGPAASQRRRRLICERMLALHGDVLRLLRLLAVRPAHHRRPAEHRQAKHHKCSRKAGPKLLKHRGWRLAAAAWPLPLACCPTYGGDRGVRIVNNRASCPRPGCSCSSGEAFDKIQSDAALRGACSERKRPTYSPSLPSATSSRPLRWGTKHDESTEGVDQGQLGYRLLGGPALTVLAHRQCHTVDKPPPSQVTRSTPRLA